MLHYSITKQMQIGLGRGLAQLTRGTRVTVNTVLPGPTWTEGVQTYIQGLAAQQGTSVEVATADYFKRREPTSIVGRFITPQEVAAAAAFLASEGAGAVNGSALRCEGGLLSHV
jgi:NAD(P)-dependent dehydrogenase (short-subunit alcohol dehydrogenase family)